jgi:hypothetical protein
MRGLELVVVLSAVALLSTAQSANAASAVQSLDNAIKHAVTDKETVLKPGFSMAQCGEIAKSNPLIRDATELELVKLSMQTNYFFVTLGALSALSDRYPTEAFEAAVHVAARSHWPLMAQPLLWPAVTNHIRQSVFNESLTQLMSKPEVSEVNLYLLLKVMSYHQLWNWFDQTTPNWQDVRWESMVLDHLWNQSQSHQRLITEKMKDRVRFYSAFGGLPRKIYLFHADRSDPQFRRTLVGALEDETITAQGDVQILVRLHGDFINREVVIDDLHASADRKAVIKGALSLPNAHKAKGKNPGVKQPAH